MQNLFLIKNKIMKLFILISIFAIILSLNSCNNSNANKQNTTAVFNGQVIHLTDSTFKQKVFNYEANKTWKFEGNKVCILDFYADWCSPCRRMAPVMEELAKDYAGEIDVYKIDTQKEQVLASALGITGLPTIIICPIKGLPLGSQGALPKEQLKHTIDSLLKIK